MPLSPTLVGLSTPARTYEIEKGAIRRFAEALESTNPLYLSEEAARAAGYPGLLAPPTFAITMSGLPVPGLPLPDTGIIHGEQSFDYGVPMTAGDSITVITTVSDLKSRGPLSFVTLVTEGTNARGEFAFRSRTLLIINEGGSADESR